MKKLWILLIGAFMISLAGSVSAHEGLPTWYIDEITAENPITIDADLSDWYWVNPATIITSDDILDRWGGELPPKDDWDCVLYGGWSASENMIYFGARVMDDIFNNDWVDAAQAYMDDSIEILVDADNSGGSPLDMPIGSSFQQLSFHIPGSGHTPVTYHWAPEEMQWIVQEPYMVAAYDDSNVPDVAIYEWKMAIWDRVDPAGEASSDRHICTANETISLEIRFDEVDGDTDTCDHQPGTGITEGESSWGGNILISNFVLLPAPKFDAVETSSWGSVKALMR